MSKLITSEADLENVMQTIVAEVISEVTEKTYNRVQEIIQEKVYDAYSPNWYERSQGDSGLKGAWVTDLSSKKNAVTGEVKHIPEMMIYNPSKYQHGSYSYGDVRENVAFYIESGFIWKAGKRPFWAKMIDELDSGVLDRWIKTGFKSRGMTIRGI